MAGHVEQSAQLVIFLMVNPFIGQPFYVGTKRAGARLNSIGSQEDMEHRRRIITTIREAGGKVQRILVAGVNDPATLLVAQAYWVRMLLHGGVDVVNCEAPPEARARALRLHLEACQERKNRHTSVFPALVQGELEFGSNETSSRANQHAISDTRRRRTWSEAEDEQLCARFLSGDDLNFIAIGLRRTFNAVLLRLNDLQKTRPQLRPRLVRAKLVGGSLGVYRPSRRALQNASAS